MITLCFRRAVCWAEQVTKLKTEGYRQYEATHGALPHI